MNLPWQVSYVLMSGFATMVDIRNVLTCEDVLNLYELSVVKNENERYVMDVKRHEMEMKHGS